MKALLRTTGLTLALIAVAAAPLAAEELLGEVRGVLGQSEFQTEDGFYMETFTDWYEAGVEYRVTVDSRDFSPVILVSDPKADFQILAAAESMNGRNVELVFDVPIDGNYMIAISSVEPDETGRFRITLSAE